ncbi:hypothetical protein [Aliiroseovarius sp. 2305UL8-7]|uniref:hypothetical protein n=1 Tax=Aliiroseovarius conchicola TaxID=3121637 RepID=UPI0035289C18
MTDKIRIDEAGTFYFACIGLTLATWRISFTLGAYGEVFYGDILAIWFVSITALIASFVLGRNIDTGRYLTWWGVVLMLLPTVVMTAAIWSPDVSSLQTILPWLLVPSIPYIAYILFSVAAPEAVELHDRRLFYWLIAILLLVNVISYFVGAFNYAFLSCEDFIVAGDEAPSNCWKPER